MRSLRRFSRFVPADDRPPGFWPLSPVNVLVATLCGLFVAHSIMGRHNPLEEWLGLTGHTYGLGEFWRLFTFWLLHDAYGVWLVPNALILLFAGRNLEAILGRRHLAAILLLGALAAGLLRAGGAGLLELATTEAEMKAAGKLIVGAGGPAFAALFAFALIMPDLELGALVYVPARIMRVKVKTLAAGLLLVPVTIFALYSLPPLLNTYDPTASHRLACAGTVLGAIVGWLYARALGYGRSWPAAALAANRRKANPPVVTPSEDGADRDVTETLTTLPWPSAPPPPASSATTAAHPPTGNAKATAGGAPVSVAEPPPADVGEDEEDAESLPALTEGERRMSARQYIAEVVDPVLEKISREGFASLSAAERRVLRKARAKMLMKPASRE